MNIPDINALTTTWVEKLQTVPGVRSAFDIGLAEDLESERVFKYPALMVLFTGMPAEFPHTIGDPTQQRGRMTWSIYVIAESMRGRRAGRKGEGGSYQIGKAVMEHVIGWELIPGYPVWLEDFRPIDMGEPSLAVFELSVANEYDLIGN